MEKQVKNLLKLIRYTPLFAVLILSTLIITIMINEQKREIEEQKNNIEKQFIKDEKERIKSNITTIYTSAKLLKSTSEDELKKDLKSRIDNAYNLMSNIYINNKDKKSKDEIIQQIKEAVDPIRFSNGQGYFSIHTMDGINILHPTIKSFEGTSVLNRKDIKGTYTVQKAISIAKTKGEGFFNWYSPKPNVESGEFEKIGLVKKFEAYNLIITTGVFKEEFLLNLKKKMLQYISKLKYKNDGYVFVIEFDGNVIYHPSKKAINANVFNEKRFTHISSLFKNLILKKGEDIGDYLSIEPRVIEGKDTQEVKTTYAKRFDDWKWIISTSFKLSDANYIIENMKDIQENKYKQYRKDIILYGIIFTILFLLISYYLSKLLENKFLKYKKELVQQITENKSQKETLLKAQKIAKIGEYELDLETNIAKWSDSMINIFGVKDCKEIYGPNLLKKIMYDEDQHCFNTSINRCMDKKVEHLCNYRIKRPSDGKTIWIECRGELTQENTLIGTVQDITVLKQKEKDLETSNTMLNFAQSQAKLGSWERFNDSGKLIWTNEVYKIFEYDTTETINIEKFANRIHPEDRNKVSRAYQKCIDEQIEYYLEYRLFFPDGRIKYIASRAEHFYDKNNKSTRSIGTVQDITEVKKVETENKKNEQIFFQQSKMASMGEMLANIAHQWRQPLSTISTASTGAKLQKEMDCLSDSQLNSALTAINDSAQYLSTTIDDFRSFFNPSDNKASEFVISSAITKTLNLIHSQFIAKDIEIVKNVEDTSICSIENEFIQVLVNIFNNSRDVLLTLEGKKRYIFIDAYKKENKLLIEIKDNAGGIPVDIIDKVFEPYFTTKHKSQGTGIGLYMSEEIVRIHLNGSITVINSTYSYEGIEYTGAMFTIEINLE